MSDSTLDRRAFLQRATKAAIIAGGAAAAGAWLYDKQGPQPHQDDDLLILPDFSVAAVPEQTMAVVQSADRVAALQKGLDLLGGISRFVAPGDRVLIKPNVAFASPAMLGATSHPDLVAALIRLCYDRGQAREVIVTDNPINAPASCFEISGLARAVTEAGATLMLPRPEFFQSATSTQGRLINRWPVLAEPLRKIDKLIGIAPVKDHHRSGASMTMKNWYGLLGGQRNIFHQDINGIISELALWVKPTFVVLDGTQVMVSNGPTGGSTADLQTRNTLIVSCDSVAADTVGAGLLDMTVNDLPYLDLAQRGGAGTTDLNQVKPLRAEVGV